MERVREQRVQVLMAQQERQERQLV